MIPLRLGLGGDEYERNLSLQGEWRIVETSAGASTISWHGAGLYRISPWP
jgi:hypothetical protein